MNCPTTILLFLLFSLHLEAAAANELIRFKFTAYGLQPGNYSKIYYEDARGEPTEIKFHKKRRSGEYEAEVFADRKSLSFLRLTNGTTGDEPKQYSQVTEVQFGEIPERLLLVFMPNRDSGQAYQVLPINDISSKSDGGSIRIINLTRVPLLGFVNNRHFELASLATSKPFRAANNKTAEFSIVAEGTSRYHLVYKNNFSFDPDSRSILFLTPPYRRASLKLGGQMLHEELNAGSE